MRYDAWSRHVQMTDPDAVVKSAPATVEKVGWTDEARAAALEARRRGWRAANPQATHFTHPKRSGHTLELNANGSWTHMDQEHVEGPKPVRFGRRPDQLASHLDEFDGDEEHDIRVYAPRDLREQGYPRGRAGDPRDSDPIGQSGRYPRKSETFSPVDKAWSDEARAAALEARRRRAAAKPDVANPSQTYSPDSIHIEQVKGDNNRYIIQAGKVSAWLEVSPNDGNLIVDLLRDFSDIPTGSSVSPPSPAKSANVLRVIRAIKTFAKEHGLRTITAEVLNERLGQLISNIPGATRSGSTSKKNPHRGSYMIPVSAMKSFIDLVEVEKCANAFLEKDTMETFSPVEKAWSDEARAAALEARRRGATGAPRGADASTGGETRAGKVPGYTPRPSRRGTTGGIRPDTSSRPGSLKRPSDTYADDYEPTPKKPGSKTPTGGATPAGKVPGYSPIRPSAAEARRQQGGRRPIRPSADEVRRINREPMRDLRVGNPQRLFRPSGPNVKKDNRV
jgi:hypothetical protein